MLGHAFARLPKHSSTYGLSSLLGASAALTLLPLLTPHLSSAEYGTLEVLTVFGAQLGILLQLGLGSAVFKFVMADDRSNGSTVICTAFYGILAVAVLMTFAIRPFAAD